MAIFLVSVLCDCGGGGGGGGGGGSSTSADFSLSASPTNLSIVSGGLGSVTLTVTAIDGFSASVSVQVGGLPPGVTPVQSSIALTPGTPQTIDFSASATAPTGSATITFTGTSASLSHTATVTMAVTTGASPQAITRTRYVRDDAVIEYYLWVNSHWEVLHAPTSRIFVTDPASNQVFVFDDKTGTQIATIPVPEAYGIDEAADQSTLYVGTLIGDIYAIDPVGMTVTHRYIASEIGPYGYQAISALPMANGEFALLGEPGGIPSVDGSNNIAVWNPTDNSITVYGGMTASGEPSSPLCGSEGGGHLFGFSLTRDRTAILTNAAGLCEFNPTTGQYLTVTPAGDSTNIVTSPDGNYIALPSGSNGMASASIYNAHTLNLVSQFPVGGDNGSDSGYVFSADSKTLFTPDGPFVYAYDVATGNQTGWMSNIVVQDIEGGFAVGPPTNPNFELEDSTGLLIGPMEEGLGFVDTTALHTGPVGYAFANNYLNPATGPSSGGTQVQVSAPSNTSQLYFGLNPASSLSLNGSLLNATTPPGSPGPVDAYLLTSDGSSQLIPEGYSYGPTILEVSPGVSTADGGGTGVFFGYGLGSVDSASIPSDLVVMVGGMRATVTSYNPDVYGITSPPFLLQAAAYTIPSGSSGNGADVTVTTSSGSATAKGGMTYIPAAQQYPLAGSSLVQGIYDPVRELYYFTDASRIQVFSRLQHEWLAPINIPAPSGATQRLWGIALSPDNTKLVVADAQADVVYLVNPANTSSITTFPFAPQAGVACNPLGVAVTNAGVVYLTSYSENGCTSTYFTLDTNTGAITSVPIGGAGENAMYLRTVVSSDNSRVFFNGDGFVFSIDTSNGAMFTASNLNSCCIVDDDELALSENQIQLEASSYSFDTNLNAESGLALNDRDATSVSYVYGAKLSPDGSLLFQPSINGIDVYDGRVEILRNRVAFSFPLSLNYDALVADGQDNVLVAITGTNGDGIAVVDLTSIGEPSPLPYASKGPSKGRSQSAASAPNSRATTQPLSNANAVTLPNRVIPHVTHSIIRASKSKGLALRK